MKFMDVALTSGETKIMIKAIDNNYLNSLYPNQDSPYCVYVAPTKSFRDGSISNGYFPTEKTSLCSGKYIDTT